MTDLARRTFTVTRDDLIAYARASGDHNPVHQDDDVARSVGLPGVIAHGMYTLALAARYVEEHAGGRGRIASIGAKFTKPVVVPPEGVEVVVAGTVDDDGTVAVTATVDGVSVLGRCRATLVDPTGPA